MDFIIEYLPLILNGFILTAQVTLCGIFMGLVLGILLAIGDLYGGKTISTAIKFYIEFFRGSPLLIQLFIFYYTVPQMLQIRIDAFILALLVFSLNSAAYQKGYIKGAMETVFEDQMTAALSIGLSKAQSIIHVILPQALRIVIPAWGNEFCSLTKSTSVLLVIGLRDLTAAGKTIVGQTWKTIETWTFIAVVYLIWISIMMKISDITYEKVRIPGIEIST